MNRAFITLSAFLLVSGQAIAADNNSQHREENAIYAIGVADNSPAGPSFTNHQASMEARVSLANQVIPAKIIFHDGAFSSSSMSTLNAEVKNSKIVSFISLPDKATAAIVKGYSTFKPAYPDAICKTHDADIKAASNLSRTYRKLMSDLRHETSAYVAEKHGKAQEKIEGVLYIKKQDIKNENGTIKVTTTMCIGDIK